MTQHENLEYVRTRLRQLADDDPLRHWFYEELVDALIDINLRLVDIEAELNR